MAEVGRSRFGLGGKLASLCLLLYRIGWSVQVAARRAAGRERRRSPSGEKRPGRWQRTAGGLGELEVLRLLAVGRSNRGIAHDLVVALDTVKKHVTHLLSKFGAANRTEAVARARQLGLTP